MGTLHWRLPWSGCSGQRTVPVVLGGTVEQGIGDLGGRVVAGLGRSVIKLGELKVAVAVYAGGCVGTSDRRFKCPVIVQDTPEP